MSIDQHVQQRQILGRKIGQHMAQWQEKDSSQSQKAIEYNHIPHVLSEQKDLNYFHMKIIKMRHVIYVWHHLAFNFLLDINQSESFECRDIFKIFILICISKKNKSVTFATHIMCLIYMISMHLLKKIAQTFLSTQNMWKTITFHCLPSLRCYAIWNSSKLKFKSKLSFLKEKPP